MTSDRKPDWYDELTPEAQADFDGWAADENDDPAVGVTEVTFVGRGLAPKPDPLRAGQWSPLCTMTTDERSDRPWRVVDVLVPSETVVSTVEELRAACGDRLAAELCAIAKWDPDEYGKTWVASDCTYLIVAFETPGRGSAYVQFLTYPFYRTVLWEVSSADYQPGLAALINAEWDAKLFARGFSKGTPPSNYTREVPIRNAEAAEGVAWESLRIVFETLKYRGGPPLVLEVVGEHVARETLVHRHLRPEQLAFVLRRYGYVAEVVKGTPETKMPSIVVAGSGGSTFVVVPEGSAGEYGYFTEYAVRADFPGVERDAMEKWAAGNRFTRILPGDGCEAALVLDIDLAGGVTEEHIAAMIRRFDEQVRSFGA